MVSFTPRPLYPRGTIFCCPLYRSLYEPQKRSGYFGKEQHVFLCWYSSHYSFFCPLFALFVISTELSQLQSWICFEKYVWNFILSICVLGCIPYRLVETCQCFGGIHCLSFQGTFSVLQSFGKFLSDYTTLQLITGHPSSYRFMAQSVWAACGEYSLRVVMFYPGRI